MKLAEGATRHDRIGTRQNSANIGLLAAILLGSSPVALHFYLDNQPGAAPRSIGTFHMVSRAQPALPARRTAVQGNAPEHTHRMGRFTRPNPILRTSPDAREGAGTGLRAAPT